MGDFISITAINNRADRVYYGCVPYAYRIAKYQLTNAEWCAFLNEVGAPKAQALKLWHKDMGSGVLGGIEFHQKGAEGCFECKTGWSKKPVVYVRYVDVCRYCNWLQTKDTEKGAYDLTGEVPRRLTGAKYALPTDSEWYKAAYYDHGRYLRYPTGDDLPRLDQMNYERGDEFAKGPPWYLTDVDEYSEYPSPWGAVQMGGNAWEMLEDLRIDARGNRLNTYRGGSFGYTETGPSKFNCDVAHYNGRCYVFGARLVYFDQGWRYLPPPFRYRLNVCLHQLIGKVKRLVKLFLRRGNR